MTNGNKDLLLTFRSASQLKARAMLEEIAYITRRSMAEVVRDLIAEDFKRLGLVLPEQPEPEPIDGNG